MNGNQVILLAEDMHIKSGISYFLVWGIAAAEGLGGESKSSAKALKIKFLDELLEGQQALKGVHRKWACLK